MKHSIPETDNTQNIPSRLTLFDTTQTKKIAPMEVEIRMLEEGEAKPETITQLAAKINAGYNVLEAGLFNTSDFRTTPEELANLIRNREVLFAICHQKIVGCIYVKNIDDDTAELGMLMTLPKVRGQGVGTKLIKAAENWATKLGKHTMQLKLVSPQGQPHPNKDFLRDWYTKMGYVGMYSQEFAKVEPSVVEQLKVPCIITTYHKNLKPNLYDKEYLEEIAALTLPARAVIYRQIEQMKFASPISVLNIGCGTGIDEDSISKIIPPHSSILGIDINPEFLKVAQSKNVGNQVNVQYKLHNACELESLQKTHGQFDVIVVSRVLQHVNDQDLAVIFEGIINCLKPGGKAIFNEPDWHSLQLNHFGKEENEAIAKSYLSCQVDGGNIVEKLEKRIGNLNEEKLIKEWGKQSTTISLSGHSYNRFFYNKGVLKAKLPPDQYGRIKKDIKACANEEGVQGNMSIVTFNYVKGT